MGYHRRLVTVWEIVPRVLQRNVSVTWVETLITTFDIATARTTIGSNLKVWYELGSWKKIWHDSRLNCGIPGSAIYTDFIE